jgi:hypothetical protein
MGTRTAAATTRAAAAAESCTNAAEALVQTARAEEPDFSRQDGLQQSLCYMVDEQRAELLHQRMRLRDQWTGCAVFAILQWCLRVWLGPR